MRKLLFIVCSIVIFAGCSSDDDKNEYGTKIGEFNAYGGVDKVSDYLFKNYRIIGDVNNGFYAKPGNIDVFYVVSAICPKEKEGHTYTDGSTEGCIETVTNKLDYNYYWHCPQCDASFKRYTGEATNSIAKGYTLQTYRLVRVNDYGKFEIRK